MNKLDKAVMYDTPPIRLDSFLERIFLDCDGERTQMVWIYESEADFDPDDAVLYTAFCSDRPPGDILNEKMCEMEIDGICWTDKGIILTVDKPKKKEE